jgi:hypothetical protein
MGASKPRRHIRITSYNIVGSCPCLDRLNSRSGLVRCFFEITLIRSADARPFLDHLASPRSEEPPTEGLGVSAEALRQRLPLHEAAIPRLRVLESARCGVSQARCGLGISIMNV